MLKSNVICKYGSNKCKNSFLFLFTHVQVKCCVKESTEVGVQIAWRSCLRIFFRMLKLFRLNVEYVLFFNLPLNCHSFIVMQIYSFVLAMVFYIFFVFFYSFILRKSGWKVLNERLQNEIEMWETINSFDKEKKKAKK